MKLDFQPTNEITTCRVRHLGFLPVRRAYAPSDPHHNPGRDFGTWFLVNTQGAIPGLAAALGLDHWMGRVIALEKAGDAWMPKEDAGGADGPIFVNMAGLLSLAACSHEPEAMRLMDWLREGGRAELLILDDDE